MGVKKGWIIVIILLNLILVTSMLKSYINQEIRVPRLIYIPDKTSDEIIFSLQKQGVPLLPIDSYLLKRYYPIKSCGWLRYDDNSSIIRLDLMQDIKEKKRERTRRLVAYSGDSIFDFAKQTSENTGIPVDELIKTYHKFSPYSEGGILAGFYKIPYRTTATATISYMVEFSEDKFKEVSYKFLNDYSPKVFKKYLIIASIIQKETWRDDEKPLISAVIYNRLKRGLKLQLDATLNYGKYSHQKVTPWRIRHDLTHFNTYRYRGLPPEPLGAVSLSSLEAAFNPAKNSYLYFVRDIFGRHQFSSTYSEHLAKITRIKVMRARVHKYKNYLKNPKR